MPTVGSMDRPIPDYSRNAFITRSVVACEQVAVKNQITAAIVDLSPVTKTKTLPPGLARQGSQ